ncbi:MAG: MFS transporter [Acidimicrobiales bacterium]
MTDAAIPASPPTGGWGAAPSAPADPRRWIALVILSTSLGIIVLDNTILNVAVPTIIREFHSEVSSLQWVISGYSLVFASLLISFGRLGDIVGRRKMFFAGATLFAVGSLIASLSHSVVQLFIGESIIEGIGAAMMLPATLSIISATFQGRERGVAFAVWGSVAGGAGALGPWVGGILTTDYSWRWAFRVNVVIAPLAILAGIFYLSESKDERAKGLDPAGVAAVTVGLLGLVFGIIEASRYGWWKPVGDQLLGSWKWHRTRSSIVPVSLAIAAVALTIFVRLEQRRRAAAARRARLPPTSCTPASATASSTPPCSPRRVRRLLRASCSSCRPAPPHRHPQRHLAAARRHHGVHRRWHRRQLSKRFGPKYVITGGLAARSPWHLAVRGDVLAHGDVPGRSCPPSLHGIGIGFATSQLTNVVLSDIPPQKAGSASGAAGHGPPGGHCGRHRAHRRDLRVTDDEPRASELTADPTIPPRASEQVLAGVGDGVGGGARRALPTRRWAVALTLVSTATADAPRPAVARRRRADAGARSSAPGAEHPGAARAACRRRSPGRRSSREAVDSDDRVRRHRPGVTESV